MVVRTRLRAMGAVAAIMSTAEQQCMHAARKERSMKWITRERAKVDRIACPWLISRFIDPQPEFLYVPADQVLQCG